MEVNLTAFQSEHVSGFFNADNPGVYLCAMDIHPCASFIPLYPGSIHPFITSLCCFFLSVTSQPIKEHHHCSGACCGDTCEPCLLSCITKVASSLQSSMAFSILANTQTKKKTFLFSTPTNHHRGDKECMSGLEKSVLFKHSGGVKPRKPDNGRTITTAVMDGS